MKIDWTDPVHGQTIKDEVIDSVVEEGVKSVFDELFCAIGEMHDALHLTTATQAFWVAEAAQALECAARSQMENRFMWKGQEMDAAVQAATKAKAA